MKKQYITPALDVVSLEAVEIVTTSPLGASVEPAGPGEMYSKQRNPIWDEDE